MTEKTEAICTYIEQHCEHSPPENARDPAKLFQRFGEEQFDQEVADLWQWGLLDIQWDDENDQQMMDFTDFGNELVEKGLDDVYVDAKLGNLPEGDMPSKPAVRVLGQDS